MRGWLVSVGTVVDLELRQRVRSTAWYVLLAVSAALLLIVSLLLLGTAAAIGDDGGPQTFSAIVFFVLLLGSLVTPALSGGAINGDRDAGTLATTQVTLVTTAQLIVGKFLAAWTASLAFLVVSVPFLLLAIVAGGVDPVVVLVALAVTVLELGVVAAVGVGLSSVMARSIFSVVTTYLVVAALSIGTLIAFGLGGLALQSQHEVVTREYPASAYDEEGGIEAGATCQETRTQEPTPRFDRVWTFLALNPYVVLADAVPATYDANGYPRDAFGGVSSGVRAAQIAPDDPEIRDYCADYTDDTPASETPEGIAARTVPGWFVGLALHLLLGAGLLVAGGSALRTPTKRLARGSRIA